MEHTETIKKNYEFRRLYAKGKSAVTPTLVVYTRRIKTDGNRVGFTVTTRLGHAVTPSESRSSLAHPILPEKYLSPKASLLPVYPDMLPVRAGSHREIRRCQGRLARIQAHLPVPSVSHRRTRFLRPCALNGQR